MTSQYRKHLILPATYRDPKLGDWTASAHIEFTEKITVHPVVLRPADVFQTELQAEKYIIQRAKEWVDKCLDKSNRQSELLFTGLSVQNLVMRTSKVFSR